MSKLTTDSLFIKLSCAARFQQFFSTAAPYLFLMIILKLIFNVIVRNVFLFI
jgi:hypothetical protein